MVRHAKFWLLGQVFPRRLQIPRLVLSIVAALVLGVIITAHMLLWLIPDLGISVNFSTQHVDHIVDEGAGDTAGVQVGDRVLTIYGRSLTDVVASWQIVTLIPPRNHPVPILVQRGEQRILLPVAQERPSFASIAYNASLSFLALICWGTGTLLGTVQHQHTIASRIVSIFWLLLGGWIGSIEVAAVLAFPIAIMLLWCFIVLLVPLLVYIHVWFPARPVAPRERYSSIACVLGISIGTQAVLATIFLGVQFSLVRMYDILRTVFPYALIIGLLASSWLLYRGYQHAISLHTRRQIRLIAFACFCVSCGWIVLVVLPVFGTSVSGRVWRIVLCGLVPVAYLIGAFVPDLYWLNRFLARCSIYVTTATATMVFLTILVTHLHLDTATAAIWSAVAFLVVYRPVHWTVLYVFLSHRRQSPIALVETTVTDLTRSLETTTLIDVFVHGVRAQFGWPAFAFFAGGRNAPQVLTLVAQERMADVPHGVDAGILTKLLCMMPVVVDSPTLLHNVPIEQLSPIEHCLLMHRDVTIWCIIRHSEGHVLGVLLLGKRTDFDPYRDDDLQILQRLTTAAALAFTNSAMYEQGREAEDTIRHLYHRVQHVQDETARTIAQRLHDEVIPLSVFDIQSIALVRDDVNTAVRNELDKVLESEHLKIEMVRNVCDELRPVALDDPYGLPATLRSLINKLQTRHAAVENVSLTGALQPLPISVQHAALNITREALHNAITHAQATHIAVQVCYPSTVPGLLTIAIRDNGRTGQSVQPKHGHWGLHSMKEHARAVDGQLDVQQYDDGLAVVFTVPVKEFVQ